MTRFRMARIIREANNNGRKEITAREIGTMLAQKYVFPKLEKVVPVGQKIFLANSTESWACSYGSDEGITSYIRIYGYFSQAEIPGYKSPLEGFFVLRDPSEWDKYYTEVRQKEKTKLTRKVIRGMEAEEFQRMCDHAFDEENLVGYHCEQQEDEQTGIVSFKVRFDFV